MDLGEAYIHYSELIFSSNNEISIITNYNCRIIVDCMLAKPYTFIELSILLDFSMKRSV